MFNFFLILLTLYKISKEYPSLLRNENAITTIPQTGTSDQNYIDKLNNIEECSCRLDDNMCNYHCCCDNNCDDENKKEWRKKNLCIDEKNSLNKAPYICISKDYFLFKMNNKKIRKRRGFEIRSLEKDYCFQIDNSDYQTEKYSTKLINLVNNNDTYRNLIFDEYIESEILKLDSNPIQEFEPSQSNDKFTGIYFDIQNNIFIKDNYFIVYGPDLNGNCIPIPVQFYKRIYQSKCKFTRRITEEDINPLGFVKTQVYEIDNNNNPNIQNTQQNNCNIVEIEFVIIVIKETQIMDKEELIYNLICYPDINNNEIIFNVRFNESNAEDINIGKFQSGRIGYAIGQPLTGNNINEYGYSIYGKKFNNNDNCLTQDDDKFDFQNDKPILFGESFTYSCRLINADDITVDELMTQITNTKAYLQLSNLNINAFGSLYYKFKNLNVESKLNTKISNKLTEYQSDPNKRLYSNSIKLNIYVDSIGPSDGPIYIISDIKIEIKDGTITENCMISFEIDYIFLKSAKDYKTSGSVLPKMPYDIIQPFIELDI